MKFTKYLAAGLIACAGLTSCSGDYLDIDDQEYMGKEEALETVDKNPTVFLRGIWYFMASNWTQHDEFSYMGSLLATDMMGQDIAMGGNHWFIFDYQLDNRMFNYRRTRANWINFYTMIAKANEIIDLYPDGPQTEVQKSLVGQAKAVRGLSYLHLIQLYQNVTTLNGEVNSDAPGVPLMYTKADGKSEEEIAAAKGRNTVKDVLAQIEVDLTSAVELIGNETNGGDKNFINAKVASGILARYYLLTQKWEKAAQAANVARKGYKIMEFDDKLKLLDGSFLSIDNEEWMWGFRHSTETQTTFASFFSHMSNKAPGYAGIGLAPKLIDAKLYSQIPSTDVRKKWFNGPEGNPALGTKDIPAPALPYANLKFGHNSDWTDNYLYMRASEMVLIEAEAYAHMGNETKAATVLKELMKNRQPGWNKSIVTVEDVYFQRRVELWGEGFAYYDLKRLNKGIDRSYEGSNHLPGYKLVVPAGDVRWTYQLPQSELQENPLINDDDQNP